jgi:hypothetical protein
MPKFRITIANTDFNTTIEQDLPDLSKAKTEALKGLLAVASEQVVAGTPFFGAEVTVSKGGERARFIVALGVTELQ